MKKPSVEVEVLKATDDFVEVQLPFLTVPVKMNYSFFRPRVKKGYFTIKQAPAFVSETYSTVLNDF